MRFEVGKWYKSKRDARYKYILVHLISKEHYAFVEHFVSGKFSAMISCQQPSDWLESLVEIKEPRIIETKTEWYAPVNFEDGPCQASVIDIMCGVDVCKAYNSIAKAKNDNSPSYSSLAKIEVTAKVTEILENEI